MGALHWQHQAEPWVTGRVEDSHLEALYRFGEWAMFTLMWQAVDFEAGLVDRCSTCYAASRTARAYEQSADPKCPDCYGTTFEGGFRAQVVRPMLASDRNEDNTDAARGQMVLDTIQIETTPDFTLRHGDFVFRFDGTRYQCESKDEQVLRSGMVWPDAIDSVGSQIASAVREEPTAVAHVIPPSEVTVAAVLLAPRGGHVPPAWTDVLRPNGYL